MIPNPKGERVLEGEDRLLCFGNLEQMRGLIPARRKRRKRISQLPDEPLVAENDPDESPTVA